MTPERLGAYRKLFAAVSTEDLLAIVEGRKSHQLSEEALEAIRVLLAERKGGGHQDVQLLKPRAPDGRDSALPGQLGGGRKIEIVPGKPGYVVDPSMQRVKNPPRAVERFKGEAKLAATKNVGIALAALVGFPLLGYLLLLLARGAKEHPFAGYCGWIGFLCLVGTPFFFLGFVAKSITVLWVGWSTPKRGTGADTAKTFFKAVRLGLWQRAFNCLTDTAQNVGQFKFPKLSDLQKMMPDVWIDSPEHLRDFWKSIAFRLSPQWSSLRHFPIDNKTEQLIVPLTVSWSVHVGGKDKKCKETIDTVFLAVEAGGYWFLTNGFFWPVRKRPSQEGEVVAESAVASSTTSAPAVQHYDGPPCVSCGKATSIGVPACPHCGWTQPGMR